MRQSQLFVLTLVLSISEAFLGLANAEDVEQTVNQYLASERSGERASLLRSLRSIEFLAVETALRNGTLAKPQAQSDTLIKRTFKTAYGDQEFETLLYLPRGYSPEKRYRLLVALHGTGGHGSQYIHAWLPWIRKRDDVILAAPSIAGEPWGGSRTAHSHVHTLIWQLTREFAIDPDRIYLGGLSMGGHAAFRIGCFRADRFAGLICRAHGPIYKSTSSSTEVPRFLENLNNTPVYWIVGQKDPGIPIERMRRGYARLQELKYPVVFREKDGGHEAYLDENENLLKWMDEHQRDPYPEQVVFHTNRPDYNRLWWVEITQFAGRPPATVKTLDFQGKTAGTRKEYLRDAIVTANYSRTANTVTVQARGVRQLAIYLSDKMLDLDQAVQIQINGRLVWQKPIRRSLQVLLEDARLRSDRSMVFSGRVVLNVP